MKFLLLSFALASALNPIFEPSRQKYSIILRESKLKHALQTDVGIQLSDVGIQDCYLFLYDINLLLC